MGMTWEQLRTHCLSLPGASETFPFGPETSVFKAANGKMFAIGAATSRLVAISVKCDPALGEALRAEHRSISPGYHLNKRHWITITLGDDAPDTLVRDLVADSHALVAPVRPTASQDR